MTPASALDGAPESRAITTAAALPQSWSLESVLANRRWLWRRRPFPHVVARDVFRPNVYRQMVEGFREYIETGPVAYAEQHDFVGGPLNHDAPEALRFFLSEEWQQAFQRLFRLRPFPHVSAGVHRHRPGSRSGFPHNDIKTEQIFEIANMAAAAQAVPTQAANGAGDPEAHCVRAAAILFYLNNSGWKPGDGGGTGLYRHWSDPVDSPEVIAPPIDNSLLAFECSPFSYHSFLHNHHQRDSLIVFLYRPLTEYLELWGPEGLSQYADG